MSNKLDQIFEKHSCPDRETFFAYLEERLDRDMIFVVEAHLLDCQFCSDALEAYREEKNLGGTQERIKEMEKAILFHVPKSGKGLAIIWRPYIKYAAILVLLLLSSVSLYLILSNKKTVDLVMEAPVSKSAPSVLREEKQSPGIPEPARAVNPEPATDELNDNGVENKQSLDNEFILDVPASGSAATTEDLQNRHRVLSKEVANPPVESDQRLTVSTDEELKDTINQVSNEQVEITESKVVLAAGKAANKSKTTSLLDSAIQSYEQGYYIYTISMLTTFQSENRKEQAKSQWYLANAFVQTKEYDKARQVLQELGAGNSSYARKARRLLQSLD